MPTEAPANPPEMSRPAPPLLRSGALVALIAGIVFAVDLADAPFVDEYAYITQSYQPDLVYSGKGNDPSWLEQLGYDLVPLPKYLINLAFRAASVPRPTRRDALAWYHNITYRWGSPRELMLARLPSIPAAALGCVALFVLGTLVAGRTAGLLAGILLAVNPLYRLHAHRAMSEAYCEGFLLLALAVGLWAWKDLLTRNGKRAFLVGLALAGLLSGLSILAKFNGLLAIMTLTAWAALGFGFLSGDRHGRTVVCLGLVLCALGAACVFVALNPFMTARPTVALPPELDAVSRMGLGARFRFLIDHRRQVSRDQQSGFPHNAVWTLPERARVVAVQGFGRFGPLGPRKSDSTIRYDGAQDWGAAAWLPLVVLGIGWTLFQGRRQLRDGQAPTAWAVAAWAGIALAVVVGYLPMAWDRYLLPIQAPAALLAAIPVAHVGCALRNRITRTIART